MHEISAESYEELRMLRSKFALIKSAVLDVVSIPTQTEATPMVVKEAPKIPCCDCVHLSSYGCSFDIPEAQTEEAKGCNLFQAII